jgi:hypothetical protein
MMITADFVDAICVQFLRPIFEDDFVEKGMKAWLTDVEWDAKTGCYKLYFDFTEFEAINEKYLKRSYYPTTTTATLPAEVLNGRDGSPLGRKSAIDLFTAKEAGQYTAKYDVFFSIPGDQRNDEAFAEEIKQYLRVL